MRSKKHFLDKAIALRKQGLSYREIRQQIPVAKSTLNYWFKKEGLTDTKEHEDIKNRKYKENWQLGVEASKQKRRLKTETAIQSFVGRYRDNKDPLFVAGCMLYKAEGDKTQACAFTNSDHRVIKLFRRFATRYFENDFIYVLWIHRNKAVDKDILVRYWCDKLNVTPNDITAYFKDGEQNREKYRREYHGTIRLVFRKSRIMRKQILAMSDMLLDSV